MSPEPIEPTLPVRVRRRATLLGDDGVRRHVGAKIPCAARATEQEGTAWVETFTRQKTSLWRRMFGEERVDLQAHGMIAWSALRVRDGQKFVATTQPLFAHPPNVRDVKQRNARSCSLAVAVVALLRRDVDAVRRLFTDNDDGSVTVRLHPQPVTVRKTVTPDGRGALWWQLLQKAFAVQGWPHDGSHRLACPGGYCDTFMQALTGIDAYAHVLNLQDDAYQSSILDKLPVAHRRVSGHYTPVEAFLAESIETKCKEGALVCMSTKARLPLSSFKMQPEHSYAVFSVRHKNHLLGDRIEIEVFEPRYGYTRFLELREFLAVAIVLCFGRIR